MSRTKKRRDAKANLEKKKLLAPEELKRHKEKTKKRIIIGIALTILIVISVVIISFNVVRAVGKSNLKKAVEISEPVIVSKEVVTEEEKEYWDPNWIKYNGKAYEYNDDILTFLIMGIDKESDVKEVAEGTDGGQADALFLVILDGDKEEIKIISINRNTMADVDIYNNEGAYVDTIKTQICVQHAYGNGLEESCERQVEAVSRLMYGIPINGYAAINMSAISDINDAVGGVEVIALETINKFKEGQEYHLDGYDAYLYTRDRNEDTFASADMRLARQKQYLSAFVGRAKERIKSNPGSALELYNALMSQMVTSVTADEVTYLASEAGNYSFAADYINNLIGETVLGDEGFEEFYYDEDLLYDLIINTFYREVEQ